jgi:hypothetical protein
MLRVAWERLLIALGISRSSAFCDMDLFTEGQTRSYWKQTRIYIFAMHVLPLPKPLATFITKPNPSNPVLRRRKVARPATITRYPSFSCPSSPFSLSTLNDGSRRICPTVLV